MRKVALILTAAALVCVAANQADAGGVLSYQTAVRVAAHPAVLQAGHHATVQQVARVHRPNRGYHYSRYYGHGYGYGRPPVVVRPPVYGHPPVVVHPPVYRHPRVVVPYAQPYYVPRRGISYQTPRFSIGIGF